MNMVPSEGEDFALYLELKTEHRLLNISWPDVILNKLWKIAGKHKYLRELLNVNNGHTLENKSQLKNMY